MLGQTSKGWTTQGNCLDKIEIQTSKNQIDDIFNSKLNTIITFY